MNDNEMDKFLKIMGITNIDIGTVRISEQLNISESIKSVNKDLLTKEIANQVVYMSVLLIQVRNITSLTQIHSDNRKRRHTSQFFL